MNARDAAAGKQVVHLPDADPGHVVLRQPVEQRRPGRRQAEVLPARRPYPGARLAHERTRDDPGDAVLALEHLARRGAGGVELRRAAPFASCAATWNTLSAEV